MKKLSILIISLLISSSSFSAEELIDSVERSVNYLGEEIIQFHVNFPLKDTIYRFDSTNTMLEWVKFRSLFSSSFPGVTIQIPLTLIVDTLTGWRVVENPTDWIIDSEAPLIASEIKETDKVKYIFDEVLDDV